MKEHIAGDGDEEFRGKELLEGRIMPGSFVRFVVGRVATRYASVLKQQNRPLIMSSLLPHEHRLSVRSIRARSARILITSLKYYEYHHITHSYHYNSRITIFDYSLMSVECYENTQLALRARTQVLHFRAQKAKTYDEPLKSKRPLMFQCGFRRFQTKPLYSMTSGSKATDGTRKGQVSTIHAEE